MIFKNMTTLARPYAVAVFEIALEKNALAEWEGMLKSASLMVQDDRVVQLLNDPSVTTKQLADLFCHVLAPLLDAEKKNFLCLLAENKRLPILPDLVMLFVSYRAEHEKNMDIDIISAIPFDKTYKQKLEHSLAKRLQRKISLQCSVDASLLGGAVVRAGDTVIDGSVRGKLNRLLESL